MEIAQYYKTNKKIIKEHLDDDENLQFTGDSINSNAMLVAHYSTLAWTRERNTNSNRGKNIRKKIPRTCVWPIKKNCIKIENVKEAYCTLTLTGKMVTTITIK